MWNLASELEECSRKLLDDLKHKRPGYIEAMQKRRKLLKEVSERVGESPCAETRAALERSRIMGELAVGEARRLRADAHAALVGLGQEQRMAQSLRALGEPQYARLDVKA